MTPRFFEHNTCLLKDERGVTLIEVLITALVLVVLVLAVYIGIMYAEKQATLNHQYRAATNIATGELDKQYFFNRYNADQSNQVLLPFSNRPVVIMNMDDDGDETLNGNLTVMVTDMVERIGENGYPFKRVVAKVEWQYPTRKDKHTVVMEEDHYPREPKQ